MKWKISYVKGKKEVADFIIKTDRICEIEDRLNKFRSLKFSKNSIEKYVTERVIFKNYKERFERSLQLWLLNSSLQWREILFLFETALKYFVLFQPRHIGKLASDEHACCNNPLAK